MDYTNRFSLPEEVCKALSKDRYIKDVENRQTDFSITTLIAPVQQTILKKRYPNCGTSDYIDNLWSMFGSICHSLLEEHASDESLVEERFYLEVNGKTISGQVDHLKNNIITDYKTTSAYKVQKGEVIEWTQQLNCYSQLARANGHKVESIRIIAIIRDWSETEAIKGNGYPKAPIMVIPIPLWTEQDTIAFINQKVNALIEAEKQTDDGLPECSLADMWADETTYACMKLEAKRATRVFTDKKEAEQFCLDKPENIVVERLGKRRRCEKYCLVNSKCFQFQQYLKQKEQSNGEGSESNCIF